MSDRSAVRRLIVPAISTAAMLAILLSLGTWQLRRLAWKSELLARIDAAEQAPGIPLGALPPAFARVRAQGEPRLDRAALYGIDVRDGVPGARALVPMVRPGAAPVLVDRGWVATDRAIPPLPPGPWVVDGYVRPGDRPGWFSVADDLPGRHFYTLDPVRIGAALGLPDIAPYVLVALGPPGLPDPARALPRPPNDHFGYALTWFGFATTLAVIFVVYARKVLRA